MKKMGILSVLLTLLVGCNKTPVLEVSDSLVGEWRHYTAVGNSHLIVINKDGEGHMEWEVDDKLTNSTKTRKWYLDDDILSFGKAAFNGESYEVIKYPKTAWEEIIHYHDTVPELTRFIILDDLYYVEQ